MGQGPVSKQVRIAEQFPKATVAEINAAIGGTGSDLGVFRLRNDVLQHRPESIEACIANDRRASNGSPVLPCLTPTDRALDMQTSIDR